MNGFSLIEPGPVFQTIRNSLNGGTAFKLSWGRGQGRFYKNYLSLLMIFLSSPFFLYKMSLGFVYFVFYFVQVIYLSFPFVY